MTSLHQKRNHTNCMVPLVLFLQLFFLTSITFRTSIVTSAYCFRFCYLCRILHITTIFIAMIFAAGPRNPNISTTSSCWLFYPTILALTITVFMACFTSCSFTTCPASLRTCTCCFFPAMSIFTTVCYST